MVNRANPEPGDHPFADGVLIGPAPRPGDRIRVTRTEVRTVVYEGFFSPIDEENDRTRSGWSALHAVSPEPGMWMRLRDQGPDEWDGASGLYSQSDVIELLEARDGADFDDLVAAARTEKLTRDEDDKKRWAGERRDLDRAEGRAKTAALFGRVLGRKVKR